MWRLLHRHRFLILVMLEAFALDQITKAVVVAKVARYTSWPETGFFRITHIGNTGSAFGLFDGRNSFLILASFIGLGVLVYFYRSLPNPGLLIKGSMGLMLAGAFGNLTDRIFRDHVVDFIDIGPWWIFNFADASIVTGLTNLGLTVVLFGQNTKSVESPAADDEPVPVGALSNVAPKGDANQDLDDDER